ncbi:hypothetical protein, conserved [Babesia bigemina]|uniref:Uncharacterized protein n=1 Tax=Babesia bigemina TaxID=5866 RepID=A0A061D8X4_BABBI|nr:hypothetical protein, conserved [Babesia bigemina]CDR95324.1 hypothetical protein, conserved [Babesia bigemina]|eukprot:XP_012767510.1 hypothetical protein, conserved [Babesia bigemina]
MKSTAVCKYDKIAHEIFAATLRAPSTSPRDQEPDSRRLHYGDLVARLANRISDEKTLKLNLLLLPQFTRVPAVEEEFLKAAIPFLTCAARPYNSKHALDNGAAILQKWADAGIGKDIITSGDLTELLISPQAFKNTLLKLLSGKSDDNRVVNMRKQVIGVSWSPCMDENDASAEAEDGDAAECTFHPKLNKYPGYLRKAPKLAHAKATLARQSDHTLDLSPCGFYVDPHDQGSKQIARNHDGEVDYGSPYNKVCPFGTTRFNCDMASTIRFPTELLGAPASKVADSPTRILLKPFGKPHKNAAEKRVTILDAKCAQECDVLNIDEKIEEIMNSLPSIARISPPHANDTEGRSSLGFVAPQRHRLCSSNVDSYERPSYGPTTWQDKLRGGYVSSGMRFSQNSNYQSPSSPFSTRNAGSLKQCDYILPRSFGIPIFKNSPAAGSHHNEVYAPQKAKIGQHSNPLDVIEAQLAQLPVNLRQILR